MIAFATFYNPATTYLVNITFYRLINLVSERRNFVFFEMYIVLIELHVMQV